MSEKRKQSIEMTDYRPGKAFQFTMDDLSANQAGFMSLSQQWDVPLRARKMVFGALNNSLLQSVLPKRRKQVLHSCGKIDVTNQLRDVHGGRFQMNSYIVTIEKANLRFSVNEKQAQALSDGRVYHIYYDPDTMRILSLERAINGC